MNTYSQNHTFLTSPWWAMGQVDSVYDGMVVNETATRSRAGLLNILSAVTIFIMLAWPELDPIRFVGPFVIFDMLAAAIFGLTPFSPAGTLGTLISFKLKPVWKSNKPKRFAWALGATLGICCMTFWWFNMNQAVISVLAICFALTWLEAVLGFCVGCWMHSKLFHCETCQE